MKKVKIRKVGNSLGLTLPMDLAKALELNDGDELTLRKSGQSLIIERLDPDLMEQMENYRNELVRFKNTLSNLT